jgi:cytochrome b561
MPVTRYRPFLVALHELLAIMIGFQLGSGGLRIAKTPNTDPTKLSPLALHMGLGTAVIVLLMIRLSMRFFTKRPGPSFHPQEGIGRLRTPMHWLLYAVALVTAGSGWFTGFLMAHWYEVPGKTLPADFVQ